MDSTAEAKTLMTQYRVKERSINFSKEEINRLQFLVDKYKNIIMCTKTDGSTTKQKDHVWRSIEKEFNATGQTPRNRKQLKYKFENMKRGARKEASKERQEMIRTRGGRPPSLPPQSEESTDWMSGSTDGDEAVYDNDIMTPIALSKAKHISYIDNVDEIVPIQNDQNEYFNGNIPSKMEPNNENMNITEAEIKIEPNTESMNITEAESVPIFDRSTPHTSLRKPVAPQLKRMINKKKRECKSNVMKQALELEIIRQTISQQKELHEQLMRHNEERHKLELIKLRLEIDALKK